MCHRSRFFWLPPDAARLVQDPPNRGVIRRGELGVQLMGNPLGTVVWVGLAVGDHGSAIGRSDHAATVLFGG